MGITTSFPGPPPLRVALAGWRLRELASGVVHHRHFTAYVLLLAAALRLTFLLLVRPAPVSDFGWYFEQGLRLAGGAGYSVTDDGFPLWGSGAPLQIPRPTAFWPVGYPGFLGALFWLTGDYLDPLFAAQLANIVLYLLAMLALAQAATLTFESAVAGRATLAILALFPNQLAYVALTSVEILFLCLVSLGTLCMMVAKRHRSLALLALSGVVFGLAAYTKPQGLLVPAAVACALGFRRPQRLVAELGVVYLTLMLTVSPWLARNYLAFHRPVLSNNAGVNLLVGNMPGSWGREGLMWNKELQAIIDTHKGEAERDQEAGRAALRYMRENPRAVLSSVPSKLASLHLVDVDGFGWSGAGSAAFRNSHAYVALRILAQCYYAAVLGLALACWFVRRRERFPFLLVGPAMLGCFSLVYVVFFGGARFHFPIVPWFAVYAAGLVARLLPERQAAVSISSARVLAPQPTT